MRLLCTVIVLWLYLGDVFSQGIDVVDVKDGLSDNFVRDIVTDSEGYVWISTINGLSRYDGYRFVNFQPQSFGVRSGDVSIVRETCDGTLWMLCSDELLTYRRDVQRWECDGLDRLHGLGIEGRRVIKFYVDDVGGLWVVTDCGLYHQDYSSGTGVVGRPAHWGELSSRDVLHIVSRRGTTFVVTSDYYIYKVVAGGILSLLTRHPDPGIDDRDSRVMLDSGMNLWLYHAHEEAGSLWVYSFVGGEWRHPVLLSRLGADVTVNALAEDGVGRLWVGTDNQGVFVLGDDGVGDGNRLSSSIKVFSPYSSHVTCFFADSNNTMWVGSAKLGAAYIDLNSPVFMHVLTEGFEDVSALLEDGDGHLWIGFDGDGVMMKDNRQRTTDDGRGMENDVRWMRDEGRRSSGSGVVFSSRRGGLPSDNVTSLVSDGSGRLLVGTYGGGIACLEGGRFVPLYADNDRLRYVKSMAQDRHGRLWVATVDRGVVCIGDDGYTYYTVANSPLLSDGIICLVYDAAGDRMYIGTSVGLGAYDCSGGRFVRDELLDSLKNVYVTALLVDDVGRLWIGSRDGLWVKGRVLTHLTTDQGLTNNVVRALAMSGSTIWASTDNGLTSISVDGDEYRCRPFLDSDGLQGIIFSNNAAVTTHGGEVLLGSLTGYVRIPSGSFGSFRRDDVGGGRSLHVRFTEFRINGERVLKSAEGFTIDYGERLGVSISMMVPALSHKARYLYRFKGEDEWMRAPNNMLYFASLMPGTHILEVKAELPGMLTSEVSELTFSVLPPLWLSKWAIVCYLLLGVLLVWLLWRAIRVRQKRELAMKQMELNLKKYEIDEQKISFFTNISHDIKTPLTMVIAPLEKIRSLSLPMSVRTEVDVAWQNARQLYDLVLEMLDMRRLDEGKEKLKLSHGELVSFVRQTVQGFDYIARRKNIVMELRLPTVPVEMLFDENKMRRIIINLLSNACKYNIDGGSVVVTLKASSRELSTIQLSVADTGIGIKDKHHVFDRFVQETHGQEQEGSGLGLHIVRQYVDMMGGSIVVEDNNPKGTVVTVTFVSQSSYEGDTIPSHEKAVEIPLESSVEVPTILIVEDNTDARLFLQRSLEDEYRVLLAANGKEALGQLGKSHPVSLIVSDVMMPVMDGLELVRQIRKTVSYSHIPVILLTAKSSEEDIIAGLKEGVAEYLTKPYSLAVLRLRIRKILEWTQHVHEQVATGIEIKPSEMTVSSLDEELISRVISEVEANISNVNYSVVQLSSAVGMTRGTLYKKLMAIVGKSPVEFIRILRIKRGKSLLDQGRNNISEVADRVGLSPKMFAQYFKDMFGITPSEYLKQSK